MAEIVRRFLWVGEENKDKGGQGKEGTPLDDKTHRDHTKDDTPHPEYPYGGKPDDLSPYNPKDHPQPGSNN